MLDRLMIFVALVAVAALSPLLAAEPAPDCFVGAHAGTGGIGGGGGCALRSNLALRISVEGIDDDSTETIDGVMYNANGDISFTRIQLDWFPTGSGFYVSGGLADTDLSVDGTADPITAVEIGSVTVQPENLGSLEMTGSFDGVEPYIGLGWLANFGNNFSFRSEFGVSSMPDPEATLVEVGSNVISDADIQAEVDEVLNELEDDFTVYPYVRLGLEFRFR